MAHLLAPSSLSWACSSVTNCMLVTERSDKETRKSDESSRLLTRMTSVTTLGGACRVYTRALMHKGATGYGGHPGRLLVLCSPRERALLTPRGRDGEPRPQTKLLPKMRGCRGAGAWSVPWSGALEFTWEPLVCPAASRERGQGCARAWACMLPPSPVSGFPSGELFRGPPSGRGVDRAVHGALPPLLAVGALRARP